MLSDLRWDIMFDPYPDRFCLSRQKFVFYPIVSSDNQKQFNHMVLEKFDWWKKKPTHYNTEIIVYFSYAEKSKKRLICHFTKILKNISKDNIRRIVQFPPLNKTLITYVNNWFSIQETDCLTVHKLYYLIYLVLSTLGNYREIY